MAKSLQPFLSEIDELIRAGHTRDARLKLASLKGVELLDGERKEIAALARRANLPSLALRVLRPLVHPTKGEPTATPAEMGEYGASLIRLGASAEATELLKGLDTTKTPEALLYRSLANFLVWDYAGSIPLLSQYVAHPAINEYQRAVGQVNLAASLVYENQLGAEAVIEELERYSRAKNNSFLMAAILLVRAEQEIRKTAFVDARKTLDTAESFLAHSDSLEALFIRKWKAIALLYSGRSAWARTALDRVRRSAEERRHYETLRSCDYHEAVALKDEALMLKVYFGTPYENFKNRLLKDYGGDVSLPAAYEWELRQGDGAQIVTLLSEPLSKNVGMKPGQVLFRLLSVLSRDFYRPVRVAVAHALLYPGEYFNPDSAPAKVRQAVKRLRVWLKNKRSPLEVAELEGAYFIEANRSCRLLVQTTLPKMGRKSILLEELRGLAGNKTFSAHEAARMLKVNLWAALRVIRVAKESGDIVTLGRNRSLRYQFSSSKTLSQVKH